MATPVVTLPAGGIAVTEVTTGGLAVTEATNKLGFAVTKVAKGGLGVTYIMDGGGSGPTPPTPGPWTDFTATAPSGQGSAFNGTGTRLIYVSQSIGNDANPGTQALPKKTLQAGKSLLRPGKPDWLLLKNGDTWTDEVFDYFNGYSGVSAAAPMLIGPWTFGGVRPLVKTNPSNGEAAFGLIGVCNFWVLYGIEFYAYTRDPANPSYNASTNTLQHSGFECTTSGTWIWIEDCKFNFYTGNSCQLTAATLTMFRNVLVNNYSFESVGHSNNYIDGVTNWTNKENIYDSNGYNDVAGSPANVFSHNWYFQYTAGNAGSHIGNITTRSGAHGGQCRPGGTITNNLFAGNSIGLLTGGAEGVNGTQGGDVTNNVFAECTGLGWGIDVNPCNVAIRVMNNIIATDNVPPAVDPDTYAIRLNAGTTGDTVSNNIIYHWGINDVINNGTGNTLTGNVINGAGYPFPTRTLSTYDAQVLGGPGTIAHFISLARNQSRNSYDPRLTADAVNTWIRAGFGL